MPGDDREFHAPAGFDPRKAEDKVEDFERLLAEAVEMEIPLVALGCPGEQIGAGRIPFSPAHPAYAGFAVPA
jgi:hypothetical protein